jgi:hypothetical protein
MIEQQVADRFQDAVANEPPLGFDPDDVIDRAIKRGRRRKVVWAVAAATAVEAAVVWTLATMPRGSGDEVTAGGHNPGPMLDVASAQPTYAYDGTTYFADLTPDRPQAPLRSGRSLFINAFTITNVDRDRGSIQLKLGDQVLYEVPLDGSGYYNRILDHGFTADDGVPVSLVTRCESSARGCRGVSVRIAGMSVQELH